MKIELRNYQMDVVQRARQAYASGKKAPLVVLPTGAGKTVVFSYISENAKSKNNKVLILLHRQELIRQTSKALSRFNVHHTIFAAGFRCDTTATVIAASIQTLISRIKKFIEIFGEPDLIITDEAHHARASQWEKIITLFPNAKIFGTTATPERSDGKGLGTEYGGCFDCLIEGVDINWLIENKFLVPPVVYAVKKDLESGTLVGNVVGNWKKYANGRPTVAFCKSVQHAKEIAEVFRACGIKAVHVDGEMDNEQRAANINGLADGSVEILTSCDVISEGVDVPAIGCVIMLRKLSSLVTYLQQVGRALRPYDGKTEAIVLDCAGNTLNFGFVTDKWNWSLAGEEKRTKQVDQGEAARECTQCYAYYQSKLPSCPRCGALPPAVKRKKTKYVNETLELLTNQDAIIKAALKKKKDQQRAKDLKNAKTYNDLVNFGIKYGYHKDWAFYFHRQRERKKEYYKSLPRKN